MKRFNISDLRASLVVALVALPLCLGIAIASGASPFAGILAGIVGGLVVGYLSGSPISVAGPAAGLTLLVSQGISDAGTYPKFLVAVVLAGLIQIVLGKIRAGGIGNLFPGSVITGMLTSIGLVLIFKQLPHALGYDKDYEGDDAFILPSGENTFSQIFHSLQSLSVSAIVIFACSVAILLFWDRAKKKQKPYATALARIPAPLAVVVTGVAIHMVLKRFFPIMTLQEEHLVSLPVLGSPGEFFSIFISPDWSAVLSPSTLMIATTIAMVASLETLLNIEASDKLDPLKRVTSRDRELIAQGVGNMVSGLLGGLPITSVVIRTTVNVEAGGRSKWAAVFHGSWLLLSVVFLSRWINLIPLSALAAILILTGFKLAHPIVFKNMYEKGLNQFIPFLVTVSAIFFTDMLRGVLIGLVVGVFFVIRANHRASLLVVNDGLCYLLRLNKDVSFFNKGMLRRELSKIPDNAYVIIDGSRSVFIDQDIEDTIVDFIDQAHHRNITVELKRSPRALSPLFKNEQGKYGILSKIAFGK